MDLKGILKAIKLNESTISMVLGALVVATVGMLVINYFREIRSAQNLTPRVTEESAQTVQAATPGAEYAVTQGESLWTIAEKTYGSGYKWVDIARENKLVNANRLLVGQKLALPKLEATVAQTPPSQVVLAASEASGGSISGDSYTVIKGDHLWGIAVRAYSDGYQWTKIAQANNLIHPNVLYVGTELKLPR